MIGTPGSNPAPWKRGSDVSSAPLLLSQRRRFAPLQTRCHEVNQPSDRFQLGRDRSGLRIMDPVTTRTPFNGRILMLGCGSVGRCTLPLILRHIDMPANRITVMDFEDVRSNDRGSVAVRRRLQAGAAHAGELLVDARRAGGPRRHHRRPVLELSRRSICWRGAESATFATSTPLLKSGIPTATSRTSRPTTAVSTPGRCESGS